MLRLAPDPAAVRTARCWAAKQCGQWKAGDRGGDAVLLVSELVSNAILHAGTDLLVEFKTAGKTIMIAVTDGSPQLVRGPPAAPLDEGGRGLLLVDALATRWGVTAWPSGKRVWAELHCQ